MTNSVYTSGRLSNKDPISPFDRYIDVYGIKIGGLKDIGGNQAVQDEFLRKVAQTVKILLDPSGEYIDSQSQIKAIQKLKEVNTLQRVGVGEYNSYSPRLDEGKYAGWDEINDTHSTTDFIWQFNLTGDATKTTNSQINEVLEHLLHTIVRFALPGAFPNQFLLIDSWDKDQGKINQEIELSGLLYEATKEAIENGVFNASAYEIYGKDSSEYWKIVMTEYQYALTFAEWGFIQRFVQNGSLDPEWSDNYLNPEQIQEGNPLGHELYNNYIRKVIAKPSILKLENIYKYNNSGESGYIPDTNSESEEVFTGFELLSTSNKEKKPIFRINKIPTDANYGFKELFSKYINVFGVEIFATSNTADDKVIHAANILAEYLDNDEDGIVDDPLILQSLIDQKATLVMFKNEYEEAIAFQNPYSYYIFNGEFNIQNLYDEETIINGSNQTQFDASLEEILHLITDYGYGQIYSDALSTRQFSLLTDAMDIARGGRFINVPSYYKNSAWFTYDDPTCDYGCQATEYFYWGLTSLLDGQNFNERYKQIQHEWKLNTPEKLIRYDQKLYNLLSNPEYNLPKILPDGSYMGEDKIGLVDESIHASFNETISTSNKIQTYLDSKQSVLVIPRSGDDFIDSLLNNSRGNPIKWASDQNFNSNNDTTVITYSFPGLNGRPALFSYPDDRGEIKAISFNEKHASDIRKGFKKLSSYANINFVEIDEIDQYVGTIRIGINTITDEQGIYREGIGATADIPNEHPRGGDIWFNKQYKDKGNFESGIVSGSEAGFGDITVLYHEILHTLGIEHPGDHSQLEFPNNKRYANYTIMMGEYEFGADSTYFLTEYSPQLSVTSTPMVYDIAALQYLYGANENFNKENTIYSYDPNTPFIETIWDGGGEDLLDFSKFSNNLILNLNNGEYSSINFDVNWYLPNNLGIAFNADIENINSGSGSDIIIGNDLNNNLKGGAGDDEFNPGKGNDSIDGESGTDTVKLSGNYKDYIFSGINNNFKIYHIYNNENEGIDILKNIELLLFSDQSVLTSNLIYKSEKMAREEFNKNTLPSKELFDKSQNEEKNKTISTPLTEIDTNVFALTHQDFTDPAPDAFVTQAIESWYNPFSGESVVFRSGGHTPKPSTGWIRDENIHDINGPHIHEINQNINYELNQLNNPLIEDKQLFPKYDNKLSEYTFFNRGNDRYEIQQKCGCTKAEDLTGISTLTFTQGTSNTDDDKTLNIIDDIKGTFDQITGKEDQTGQMFRFYNAAFARFPDADGLRYWIDMYSSGANTIRQVAASFLGSEEFAERYGANVSDSKYIDTLYTNVLGRLPDAEGKEYWMGRLTSGAETRAEALLGFAESDENKILFSEMTGLV